MGRTYLTGRFRLPVPDGHGYSDKEGLPAIDLRADRSTRASPCLATTATVSGTMHIPRPRGSQMAAAMAAATPTRKKTAETLAQTFAV